MAFTKNGKSQSLGLIKDSTIQTTTSDTVDHNKKTTKKDSKTNK